jgi:hypothetical protein
MKQQVGSNLPECSRNSLEKILGFPVPALFALHNAALEFLFFFVHNLFELGDLFTNVLVCFVIAFLANGTAIERDFATTTASVTSAPTILANGLAGDLGRKRIGRKHIVIKLLD